MNFSEKNYMHILYTHTRIEVEFSLQIVSANRTEEFKQIKNLWKISL